MLESSAPPARIKLGYQYILHYPDFDFPSFHRSVDLSVDPLSVLVYAYTLPVMDPLGLYVSEMSTKRCHRRSVVVSGLFPSRAHFSRAEYNC